MKRTKQSTFAKRERSEKSTGFAPVGSEAMIHKHTYSIPSADDQNDVRCIECGQLQPTTHTAKHTPGPWTARKAPERNAYAWDVEGAQGTVSTIARMALVDRVSEVEGNAHLIAAAPVMYEALQDAYEKLCYLAPDKFDDEEHAANWQRDLSTMLAALAQAEGREG